jgi:Na+/melibiose symporter-like transporter
MGVRDSDMTNDICIPERLPRWKLIVFALGQLGWSLASYGVSNLVMYFYMPPEDASAHRVFPSFLFEGAVLGVLTIIGLINFGARAFDAVTNPLLASWSDRSKSKLGRRRFFMAISAAPFALFSVLVFLPLKSFALAPSLQQSLPNALWLAFAILVFYFFFVMYTAPYNALICELGHNPRERLTISTVISITWALGFAIGNFVYDFQTIFERSGMDSVRAFQTVEALCAALAFVLMILPVIFIDERRYAAYSVSEEGTLHALKSSLSNRNFLVFLIAELLYFVCQTIIQMGIVYYVITLLGLPKEETSILMMGMFVLSFVFYPVVTWAARKWEKRRVLLAGFAILFFNFVTFALMGVLKVPSHAFAWFAVITCAPAQAIFGILPNAVVADIAEADGIETGNFKAGIFFGVRSFETNVGTSLANILFPSLLTLGMSAANPFGIRMSAIVSVVICVAGFLVFFLYDERKTLKSLAKKERITY